MLHNDNYNRREYVVKVLLKVVKGMTVDDAVQAMNVRGIDSRLA
jgi:ATP-dependent Clp protease adaptor protein ClpS